MKVTADHTETSWRWRWQRPAGDGEMELAWVTEKAAWQRRFRPADPDGTKGGWTLPQPVPELDRPDDETDAAGFAESYATGLSGGHASR